jgi:hypothetical protein
MTEHTQIKQNKYSAHDKPKCEFIENTSLWTLVRPFYIPQTQRPNSERDCRSKHHEMHTTRTYVMYIYTHTHIYIHNNRTIYQINPATNMNTVLKRGSAVAWGRHIHQTSNSRHPAGMQPSSLLIDDPKKKMDFCLCFPGTRTTDICYQRHISAHREANISFILL